MDPMLKGSMTLRVLATRDRRLLSLFRALLISFAAFFYAGSAASAATLIVVGGQLYGAAGVNVGGTIFDVQFLDGTCIAVFDGCDSTPDDLTFDNATDALLASQALLDQVFVDQGSGLFDSVPSLISGCTDPNVCTVRTLFVAHANHHIAFGYARNFATGAGSDLVDGDVDSLPTDTTALNDVTFARWTPVPAPVPGPGLLTALGLLALGFRALRETGVPYSPRLDRSRGRRDMTSTMV